MTRAGWRVERKTKKKESKWQVWDAVIPYKKDAELLLEERKTQYPDYLWQVVEHRAGEPI